MKNKSRDQNIYQEVGHSQFYYKLVPWKLTKTDFSDKKDVIIATWPLNTILGENKNSKNSLISPIINTVKKEHCDKILVLKTASRIHTNTQANIAVWK